LTSSDPALVRIEVADSGPGAAHPHVMARGQSTADSTGLGLDIVRRASIAAGGDLVVATSEAGGMLAVVTLGVPKG
jgi:signal transduction histidine kinase